MAPPLFSQPTVRSLVRILACVTAFACQPGRLRGAEVPARPHLFLAADTAAGGPARTLAEFRRAIRDDAHVAGLWKIFLAQADHDLAAEIILPKTYRHHRDEPDWSTGNRDFTVVFATGQRILRGALASLITGEMRYRDAAWAQIEVLFNHPQWSDWRDLAHVARYPADLRTGMFARDLGLAFDWLYPVLTPAQRQWLVAGLGERAIKPFWQSVEQGASWTKGGNNWSTVIVGGLGVLGMALAGEHADAARLVEFSRHRMTEYLKGYGPAGEFDESVGYSNSSKMPVLYFSALRCATGGGENKLAGWPLETTAVWNAYTYLPPGRYAALGDGGVTGVLELEWFGAIASASRNGVLQWFHRRSAQVPAGPAGSLPNGGRECALPWWMLGYDATLPPTDPEGALPHGRAFLGHAGLVSSRTDWNLEATPCVVYGKAGIERYHHHHDAGQVCIDGYGQRLVTDLGSMPGYPLDYARARERYYNSAWAGHNVLTLTDRAMPDVKVPTPGKFIASQFDDIRGGWWQMDLTGFYPGAKRVVRTVVHLNPATVAVLDEADFATDTGLALRWHTIDRATPDEEGRFTVAVAGVHLGARVIRIDGGRAQITQAQHEYSAPHHLNRLGFPYPQPRESFVLTAWRGTQSRVLSLFAITPPGAPASRWETVAAQSKWRTATPAGDVTVELTKDEIRATHLGTGASWVVPTGRLPAGEPR